MDNDLLIKRVRDAYDAACDSPHPDPALVIDDSGASIWTFAANDRWVRITMEGIVRSAWSDARPTMEEELADGGAQTLGTRIARFLGCH